MRARELDYDLPPELIAQNPADPRDSSRLLVYDRRTKEIQHLRLPDLLAFLSPPGILVYNDSRVIRARVFVQRKTGGKVELLFLRLLESGLWEALAKPSARLKAGEELKLPRQQTGEGGDAIPAGAVFSLVEPLGGGRWLVDNLSAIPMETLLEVAGEMPLPPYIKEKLNDPGRYQTVYADAPGSAAAPTAGLHFTPRLLERIGSGGIGLYPLTLHIGLDTFQPVNVDDLSQHRIHSEYFRVSTSTLEAVKEARRRGGRVVAVGTTAVRVLETIFGEGKTGEAGEAPGPPQTGGVYEGETKLFITPGHKFRAVDAMITNFHLPRSTLLALVMAFAGIDEVRRIYQEAISRRYRFYSFGDAMLIL